MEYFVTGATGLIGTHVCEQLVSAGHDVIGLTRSRDNASHLPAEVTVVEGDITEKASMRDAMRDVDGVFHIAAWFFVGPGPREAAVAEQINVTGTRNVFELIAELAIPKGVYTSTLGVFPGTGDEVLVETMRPECPTYAVYHRTKWEAHYEVAVPMIEDGLPLVIVMPGAVYGPYDKPRGSTREIFRNYLTRDLPMIPRGLTLPFDHAADTADAHRKAMEKGRPGEEYIIASEARPIREVFACAHQITGVPPPRTVPNSIFSGLARIMRVVERFMTPPEGYEPELLEFAAGRKFIADASKARRELGVTHRSLEVGLREYLEWELDHSDLEIDITPHQP